MWRNDMKCKYMSIFTLKNLACKGLIQYDIVKTWWLQVWYYESTVYDTALVWILIKLDDESS